MRESIRFKYGTLKLLTTKEFDDEYFWSGGTIKNTNKKMDFKEPIPISVFTKKKLLEPLVLEFIETTLSSIDVLLEKAILYLKNTLLENSRKYNLKNSELSTLELGIYRFPVDLPEVIFYANNEWMIRFATGAFEICGPYGIAVLFKEEKPISVEDLSESEIID